MSIIANETPTGTIDGVNKDFTLLNTPTQILDVVMDGAEYFSFSFVGNIITLTDAPTVSLFIDYEDTTTTVNPQTDLIWGDVKDQIWINLGQTSSSTTFSNEILDNEMNSLVYDIYRGRVQNPLNGKIYRAGNLDFINGNTRFRYVAPTQLTANVALGDTEIEMVTTRMPSTGTVMMGGDIIKYTSKTDSQIEGVTGITITHLATEKVTQLYLMPEELDKPTELEYIVKNTDNGRKPLLLDNTGTYDRYYQIVKSGTETYIKVVGLDDTEVVIVDYIKNHTLITNDATTFPIEYLYGLGIVANIVSGKLGYGKGMPNSEQQLMIGFTNLQSMFQYYTNETNVIKQSLRAVPYSRMRRS